MTDDKFDFSPLDLELDPEKFERMVGNIMWRSRNELARRAAGRMSAIEAVASWFRPAMVAAAAIAAVSLTLLASIRNPAEADVQTGAYMSAAEVPAAVSSWYEEDVTPTAAELLVAANEGGR